MPGDGSVVEGGGVTAKTKLIHDTLLALAEVIHTYMYIIETYLSKHLSVPKRTVV